MFIVKRKIFIYLFHLFIYFCYAEGLFFTYPIRSSRRHLYITFVSIIEPIVKLISKCSIDPYKCKGHNKYIVYQFIDLDLVYISTKSKYTYITKWNYKSLYRRSIGVKVEWTNHFILKYPYIRVIHGKSIWKLLRMVDMLTSSYPIKLLPVSDIAIRRFDFICLHSSFTFFISNCLLTLYN